MSISVYAAGNLCLVGNIKIIEPTPATPSVYLYVGGQVQLEEWALSDRNLQREDRPGRHRRRLYRGRHAKICSNAPQSKVYANSYISTPSR